MPAISPLLKPLGVAASSLAIFEALSWGILSLLGMLACLEVYNASYPDYSSVEMPLSSWTRIIIYEYLKQEKDTTLPFMAVYLASSVVWLIVSSLLLHDFLKNKFRYLVLVIWSTVTFAVCALDFAATVFFGVEFGNSQNMYDAESSKLLPSMIIMLLSARGFVLWLANFAAAVYLSIAAQKLKIGKYSDKEHQNAGSRRMSDAPSLYGSMSGERDYSRVNLAYQPEPLSAWNIQSPTVGDAKRGPWNFSENSSPAKIFPRIGRPVSTPVAPVSPLPIPHPDYSPPLSRPVRHEPNMYETPLRSALKKPAQFGRTIL